MNVQRLLAVSTKELREVARDKLYATLAFAVPTFLMFLIGFCLAMDVENVPIAIVDNDNTPESRDLAARFYTSRYFHLKTIAYDDRQLDPLLRNNVLRAVIVIPAHFAQNIRRGLPAPVQVLLDGTYTGRGQITKGYITGLIASANAELQSQGVSQATGISSTQAAIALQPIDVRYIYNPSMKSALGLTPRLLVLILYTISPVLTALGVVREKETGSIFNVYASTITRSEYLIGKLLPYIGIAFLNGVILLLIALLVFKAPFRGSLFSSSCQHWPT